MRWNPQAGVTVTFKVSSGPNMGQTGTAVTGATGKATFTYSDTGGVGTDTIVATFTDRTGGLHTSNSVQKIWKFVSFLPGRMTGGGTILNSPGATPARVTHGFELHCDVTKTPNNLEVNWGS